MAAAFLLGGWTRWRKWDKFSLAYAIGFVWQFSIWMLFTHLQTRFLLPILAPAALLLCHFWSGSTSRPRRLVVILTAAGLCSTVYLSASAYSASTALMGSSRGFYPVAGRHELVAGSYPFSDPEATYSDDTKVLLVGEARPFYVRSAYVYNTVFDRCLLGDLLAAGAAPEDVIGWLRDQGITHVYVNWEEVARLQKYYGYSPAITPMAFEALELAGLRRLDDTQCPLGDSSRFSLYQLSEGR